MISNCAERCGAPQDLNSRGVLGGRPIGPTVARALPTDKKIKVRFSLFGTPFIVLTMLLDCILEEEEEEEKYISFSIK